MLKDANKADNAHNANNGHSVDAATILYLELDFALYTSGKRIQRTRCRRQQSKHN